MATDLISNQCSLCKNNEAKCSCTGCKQFFCINHFLKHRQQLVIEFDNEIITNHDQLLEEINQINQSKHFYDNILSLINQWEKKTIEKIKEKAEEIRHQLTKMNNAQTENLIKQFEILSTEIRHQREEENFDENNLKYLQQQINQIQKSLEQLPIEDKDEFELIENDQINWDSIIYLHKLKKPTQTGQIDITSNTKWTQYGITIAGGHEKGSKFNQLAGPLGLCIDDNQNILIADRYNHRIIEWKRGANVGRVVAGGHGRGNQNDQLSCPSDVIIDKETNSIIICDRNNERIVRWSRQDGTFGETIISDVISYGIVMDDKGFLYVSNYDKHEVRRWRIGDTQGTLVAGGNGQGNALDQFNYPFSIFVDNDQSLYVSDYNNHRVMKWMKGAKQGIVVAGGHGRGNDLTQLSCPRGLFVDHLNTVYVVDSANHRIMRWPKEATQGNVVVGGNGTGIQSNQLFNPIGLSFDLDGHLYVVDQHNHRVQKFLVEGF